MQISTTKNGRKVKLTAAELRVLDAAACLCRELGELAADADAKAAAEPIAKVHAKYAPKPEAADEKAAK